MIAHESTGTDDTDATPADSDAPAAKPAAEPSAADDDDNAAPDETSSTGPRSMVAQPGHQSDAPAAKPAAEPSATDDDDDNAAPDVDAEEAHEALKHGGIDKVDLDEIKKEGE